MRPEFRDTVLILDDDLNAMLERPKLHTVSIKAMGVLIGYLLKLRTRFTGQKVPVHSVMLEVGEMLGVQGGAIGPIAALSSTYGDAGVDEPVVVNFFKTWVERCRAAK